MIVFRQLPGRSEKLIYGLMSLDGEGEFFFDDI